LRAALLPDVDVISSRRAGENTIAKTKFRKRGALGCNYSPEVCVSVSGGKKLVGNGAGEIGCGRVGGAHLAGWRVMSLPADRRASDLEMDTTSRGTLGGRAV
jgi:hypothetical protein